MKKLLSTILALAVAACFTLGCEKKEEPKVPDKVPPVETPDVPDAPEVPEAPEAPE